MVEDEGDVTEKGKEKKKPSALLAEKLQTRRPFSLSLPFFVSSLVMCRPFCFLPPGRPQPGKQAELAKGRCSGSLLLLRLLSSQSRKWCIRVCQCISDSDGRDKSLSPESVRPSEKEKQRQKKQSKNQ